MTLSAVLTMPDNSFACPGVLFTMAPPRPEKSSNGQARSSPHHGCRPYASLDVSRPQHSDMLGIIAAGRFRHFHFTVGEQADSSFDDFAVVVWTVELEATPERMARP
jgi:hypothetical protein